MKLTNLRSPIPRLDGRSVQLQRKTADPAYMDPRHIEWSRIVRERADYTCEKCGRTEGRMFADHIKELKDGGEPFDVRNGTCLCGACHTRKTAGERANRL